MTATTSTIIPRTCEFTPEELADVAPRRLMQGFRTDLYANGAATAGGWLFACLHGEFDPKAGLFRLHVHCLASIEMVPVIDRLRTLPRYKAVKALPDGTPSPVYRRVWVRRKPLENLPSPLTYLVQSFWPSRPILFKPDGTRQRVREKRRIPEPHHSQMLLWLDRWRLDDLTLRIGIFPTRKGLRLTRRPR